MNLRSTLLLTIASIMILGSCGQASSPTPTAPAAEPLPNGLLLGLAVLEKGADGRPVPQPAQLGILTSDGATWTYRTIDDPDSNVFHKAMVYTSATGDSSILTAGGTKAMLKLWPTSGEPQLLWEKDFGGKFSRMRDVEVGDIDGNGTPVIAVVTHDQGVVALIRPDGAGGFTAEEIDAEPNTIIHEVELGDLDGDGVLEVYATPSLPNKLDGTPQPGEVVRYVPAKGEGRVVVADLGDEHAKEILVEDVDGDGTDELYVSIEAVAGGQVEIRRYDAGTDPNGGTLVAKLEDKLCRFLTAGDLDGDGVLEMVAAANKSGLWLFTPTADGEWSKQSIDRASSGFEHAAILTDLDGDGTDELYVANDSAAEVNRYVLKDGLFEKETLYRHPAGLSGFTWNIMPFPVDLMPAAAQ